MITYKKPSIDEIRAIFHRAVSFVIKKWKEFQNKEHSTREWVVIFAFALILGMAGKVIAIKTFTIGYEDYLISKATVQPGSLEKSTITKGPICEE